MFGRATNSYVLSASASARADALSSSSSSTHACLTASSARVAGVVSTAAADSSGARTGVSHGTRKPTVASAAVTTARTPARVISARPVGTVPTAWASWRLVATRLDLAGRHVTDRLPAACLHPCRSSRRGLPCRANSCPVSHRCGRARITDGRSPQRRRYTGTCCRPPLVVIAVVARASPDCSATDSVRKAALFAAPMRLTDPCIK